MSFKRRNEMASGKICSSGHSLIMQVTEITPTEYGGLGIASRNDIVIEDRV